MTQAEIIKLLITERRNLRRTATRIRKTCKSITLDDQIVYWLRMADFCDELIEKIREQNNENNA